jgi:hypothetical protein
MSNKTQSEQAVEPANTEYIVVNHAVDEGVISLPETENMLNADFVRAGADLLITSADGTQIVIAGYFDSTPPPDLVTQDGLIMSPDLVEALAGASMGEQAVPDQYASLDTTIEPVAIGTVQDMIGTVMVTRADGTQSLLEIGTAIFEGDLIEVGSEGAVTIRFVDDSTFSLDENSQMVIDEMIFDTATLEGQSVISLINGVFVFVSGEIAINNPGEMLIKTPVSTLGVRASLEVGIDAQEGHAQTVVVLASNEPPDSSGALLLQSLSGSAPLALTSTYDAAVIVDAYSAPARTSVTPAEVDAMFGKLSISGLRIFDDVTGIRFEPTIEGDQSSLDSQATDPRVEDVNAIKHHAITPADILGVKSLESVLDELVKAAGNENVADDTPVDEKAAIDATASPAEKSSSDKAETQGDAPPANHGDDTSGYSSVAGADVSVAGDAGDVQVAEAL